MHRLSIFPEPPSSPRSPETEELPDRVAWFGPERAGIYSQKFLTDYRICEYCV